MEIIGWIIWSVTFFFAICWIFGFRYSLKKLPSFFFLIIAILFFIFDWNKLHILWLVPICLFSAPFIANFWDRHSVTFKPVPGGNWSSYCSWGVLLSFVFLGWLVWIGLDEDQGILSMLWLSIICYLFFQGGTEKMNYEKYFEEKYKREQYKKDNPDPADILEHMETIDERIRNADFDENDNADNGDITDADFEEVK